MSYSLPVDELYWGSPKPLPIRLRATVAMTNTTRASPTGEACGSKGLFTQTPKSLGVTAAMVSVHHHRLCLLGLQGALLGDAEVEGGTCALCERDGASKDVGVCSSSSNNAEGDGVDVQAARESPVACTGRQSLTVSH